MSREEALQILDTIPTIGEQVDALEMAISALNSLEEVYAKGYNDGFTQAEINFENDKALSQEPCDLLIIKSDIYLHQEDRRKWMESIKREKENGVIILPPYFKPLLVPDDIEINIEQKSGEWLDINGIYAECSNCNEEIYITGDFKYCPNCGAKMERSDKE